MRNWYGEGVRSAEKSVCHCFVKLRSGGIDESSTESALCEGFPGGGSQIGSGSRRVGGVEAEVKMERDLLKKFAAYIATDEGWRHLAGLKDLYYGEIVSYAMGEHMTRQLVMQALFRAVSLRRPPPGLR